MTKTEAQIRSEVIATLEGNIARLETELASGKPGYVHVWPNYGLGVRINEEGVSVVCVSQATIVKGNDRRSFTNGAKIPTQLTERKIALADALERIRASYASLKAALDDHTAREIR